MVWQSQWVSQMTDARLEKTYAMLSPSRKEHIDRFRKPADRARSLTGEWLLRQMLAQHYRMLNPVILRQDNGQPVLENSPLHISIAHSEDLVVCAVSETPVGIDTEKMVPFRWALAEKICTSVEKAYLGTASRGEDLCQDPDTIRRFFEIWTGKEAWFKMQGTGLQNLQSVNVPDLQGQLFCREDYLIQIIQG